MKWAYLKMPDLCLSQVQRERGITDMLTMEWRIRRESSFRVSYGLWSVCLSGTSSTRGVKLFQRVLSTGKDLGLFSGEYDPESWKMLDNFPQCLTHLSLIPPPWHLQRRRHDKKGPHPGFKNTVLFGSKYRICLICLSNFWSSLKRSSEF